MILIIHIYIYKDFPIVLQYQNFVCRYIIYILYADYEYIPTRMYWYMCTCTYFRNVCYVCLWCFPKTGVPQIIHVMADHDIVLKPMATFGSLILGHLHIYISHLLSSLSHVLSSSSHFLSSYHLYMIGGSSHVVSSQFTLVVTGLTLLIRSPWIIQLLIQ